MEITSYITGFTDGEGSFLVSFSIRPTLRAGIEARPSFSLSQHERSKEILSELRRYFECGSIRFDRHDQTYKYEVRSLSDLVGRIIPHFKKFPLKTSKSEDFNRFAEICQLMTEQRHRTKEGMKRIVDLAYGMNNLGARRFAKSDLLQEVDKVKV